MQIIIKLIVLYLGLLANISISSPVYFITVPKSLLLDSQNKINIQLKQAPTVIRIDTVDVKSGLVVRGSDQLLNKTISSINYLVPITNPSDSGLQLIFIVDTCDQQQVTQCKVDKGHLVHANVTLPVLQNNFIIFGETSKPIYKPGELVQFRFLPVYPTDLKTTSQYGSYRIDKVGEKFHLIPLKRSDPVQQNFDLIFVEDPNQVRTAQWRSLSWEVAMNLSHQLNQDTTLGQWKIVAHFGGQIEEAKFQVQKYVLPKFTVDLQPPSTLVISDTWVAFSVCARYSTGRPMKAKLQAELCVGSTGRLKDSRPCLKVSGTLSGSKNCVNFNESTSALQLRNNSYVYWDNSVQLTATVEEEGTGEKVNSSQKGGKLQTSLYKLSLESHDYFKTGLPYYGSLKTLKHDGTPYPNARISVGIKAYNKWGFKQNYTSDKNGVVLFTVPIIKDNEKLSLHIEDTNPKERYDHKTVQINSANQLTWIKPWISVSNISMQLYRSKQSNLLSPSCPGSLKIKLQANAPLARRKLYAQIFSRGRLLSTQILPAKSDPEVMCKNQDGDLGHYKCLEGRRIKCLPGWTGNDCQRPVCPDNCNRGACIAPNVCACMDGWEGPTCRVCIQRQGCVNGVCAEGNDCRCLPGWQGPKCNYKSFGAPDKNPGKLKELENNSDISNKLSNEDEYQELTLFFRTVKIKLDKLIGPEIHVVVYFFEPTANGTEIVAESFEVSNLHNCTTNNEDTQFGFNATEVAPGNALQLDMSTGSNSSKCSLRISDISLKAFGSSGGVEFSTLVQKLIDLNHKITEARVGNPFNELLQTHCRKSDPNSDFPSWNPRRQISPVRSRYDYMPRSMDREYDSAKSFNDAGVFVLTNSILVSRKCPSPILLGRGTERRVAAGSGRENRLPDGIPGPAPEAVELSFEGSSVSKQKQELRVRLREFFPETWKFDYLVDPPQSTILKVPDSMTTWRADAYCMTQNGLWIAPTRSITVILPFYIQITLPYSIKNKEILHLPVKLFNYLDDCYEIQIAMQTAQEDFQIVGPRQLTTCLCDMEQKTVHFQIRPKRIGELDVVVYARSTDSTFCSNRGRSPRGIYAADAVKRKLLVQPEGIAQEITVGELLCHREHKLSTVEHSVALPNPIVEGSMRSYVIYSGDVMGSSISNLNHLVRMPYGCGEQNMVAMVPSIYVLDYFTAVNIHKPDVVEQAKGYIQIGYNRQLQYQHKDGSYSAFGSTDKFGSSWLTAFVLKSFTEAQRYATISNDVLSNATRFLLARQKADGCFEERGQVFSSTMRGGSGQSKTDEVLLTAYILTALRDQPEAIENALKCVSDRYKLASSELSHLNNYTLAVVTYSWSLHKPTSQLTSTLRETLKARAITSSTSEYWSDESSVDDKRVRGERRWIAAMSGTSAEVETTAYAYLALEDSRPPVESQKCIKWITSQKNSLGGFYSTQDTVMGLRALANFARRIHFTKGTNLQLSVSIPPAQFDHEEAITENDRLVTRKIQLPALKLDAVDKSFQILWSVNGTGCAYVQSSTLFNIPDPVNTKSPFALLVNVKQESQFCQRPKITTCIGYTDQEKDSNMVLLTVHLASGWTVNANLTHLLDEQIGRQGLKRIDTMSNAVSFYFDSFPAKKSMTSEDADDRCVTLDIYQSVVVENAKPAVVNVMDYYQPELSTDSTYQLDDCMDRRQRPGSATVTTPRHQVGPQPKQSCAVCLWQQNNSMIADKLLRDIICPYSGAVVAQSVLNAQNWRLFMAGYSIFYEWNANLLPDDCNCLQNITNNEDLLIVSRESWKMYVGDDIRLEEDFLIMKLADAVDFLRSNMTGVCRSATALQQMTRRLYPKLLELSANQVCPYCPVKLESALDNSQLDIVCNGVDYAVNASDVLDDSWTVYGGGDVSGRVIEVDFRLCDCDLESVTSNYTVPLHMLVRRDVNFADASKERLLPDGRFVFMSDSMYMDLRKTCPAYV